VNEEALAPAPKEKNIMQIVALTSHLMGNSYANTDLGVSDNKMK